MQLYDWGKATNLEKYGQETPPKVELSKIIMPTAMFVGIQDDLGDVQDCRDARDEINKGGDALKYYEEIPAGHQTFLVGLDMSYVDKAIELTNQYNSLY